LGVIDGEIKMNTLNETKYESLPNDFQERVDFLREIYQRESLYDGESEHRNVASLQRDFEIYQTLH